MRALRQHNAVTLSCDLPECECKLFFFALTVLLREVNLSQSFPVSKVCKRVSSGVAGSLTYRALGKYFCGFPVYISKLSHLKRSVSSM